MQQAKSYLKTERTFTAVRRWAWIVTLAVAVGGQVYPRLGLLVPLIMASLMAMSLVRGRYWCGNYCPHGSFFDFLLLPVSKNRRIPSLFTSRLTAVLFFLFFMFNLARRFVTVFQNAGSVALPDRVGLVFSTTYLVVLIAGGLLAVMVSPRTWCHFCPMGFMQTLLYRLGKALGVTEKRDVKVMAADAGLCTSCGKCSRVCPMQLAPYREFDAASGSFNDERCIKCRTCVKYCPKGILRLAGKSQAGAFPDSSIG